MLFLILNGIHAQTFPEHVFLVRVDQWDAFLPFIFWHSSRKLDNSVQVQLVLNSINQDSNQIRVMCTCKQSYTNGALKSKGFLFSGSFSETCSVTFLDWSQKKEVLISVIRKCCIVGESFQSIHFVAMQPNTRTLLLPSDLGSDRVSTMDLH